MGVTIDVLLRASGIGTSNIAGLIAVPLACMVSGHFATEFALRKAVALRTARITSELPTVFEFTSLCLAAGESIMDSLRRVAQVGSGDFAAELANVTRQVDTGVPLALALNQLSGRLQLPPVTRGIEQILGPLDRGSPLAAVLQTQAQDAREDSKRELLEKAGQKEVIMFTPRCWFSAIQVPTGRNRGLTRLLVGNRERGPLGPKGNEQWQPTTQRHTPNFRRRSSKR